MDIPKSKAETIEMLSAVLERKQDYIELLEESLDSEEFSILPDDAMDSITAEIELSKIEFTAMVCALAYLKGADKIPDMPKTKGKPKLHLVN